MPELTRSQLIARRERSLRERYHGCVGNYLTIEADRVLEELAIVQMIQVMGRVYDAAEALRYPPDVATLEDTLPT